MKQYLFYIIIISLVISCGEKRKSPPVNLKRGTNKTVQVTESKNSTDDNHIDPVRYYPQEADKDESIILDIPIVETNTIKTKKFYYDLLNEFCKMYYYRKFKGTSYIYGSILVQRVTKEDENTVEVKGSHSFKGLIKTFEQREFVATIRDFGNYKYNVLFRRRGWATGQWKDTGNIMFRYNPEE